MILVAGNVGSFTFSSLRKPMGIVLESQAASQAQMAVTEEQIETLLEVLFSPPIL